MQSIVRVGTVTDVNATSKMARVKFQDKGITSGWLYVIQRKGETVSAPEAGEHSHTINAVSDHTHTYGDSSTGSSGGHTHTEQAVSNHKHEGAVTTGWMPQINDTVLCVYLPIFNGDGFIIGGVG